MRKSNKNINLFLLTEQPFLKKMAHSFFQDIIQLDPDSFSESLAETFYKSSNIADASILVYEFSPNHAMRNITQVMLQLRKHTPKLFTIFIFPFLWLGPKNRNLALEIGETCIDVSDIFIHFEKSMFHHLRQKSGNNGVMESIQKAISELLQYLSSQEILFSKSHFDNIIVNDNLQISYLNNHYWRINYK